MKTSFILNFLSKKIIISTFWLAICVNTNAQDISGIIFLDGNNNGVKDATEAGFPLVIVKAFNASNMEITSAISLNTPQADLGKYTLTGLNSGEKYRIEFSLPDGYNDGAFSSTSNTSVQFVTANATNVNFGVYVPGQCLPDKTIRMVAGCANNTLTGMTTSIASWDYASKVRTIERYTNTPHTPDVNSSVTGTPFALTAQKVKGAVKVILTTVSSPNANVTPVSPDGANAIYMADYSGPNNTYLGIKLLTKLSVNSTNQNPVGAVTNVGEYGLGGIAISDDNKTLYVVNMGNGKIAKVDVSSVDYATIPSGGYTNLSVSEITIPTSISACTNGIFRPSIVKYYAGAVYVAGVCDASTSTPARNNSNLRLKILKMNPADNSFTVVMDADLSSFQAGSLGSNAGQGPNPGHFQTIWKDGFLSTYGGSDGEVQPMVNDIAFDDTGSLLVGVANRATFKAGNDNPIEMGYIVRTWRKADGTFELENAGISGPFTSTARINVLTSPYANSQNDIPTNFDNDNRGPGLKYFFEQGIVVGSPNNGHPYCYNGGVYIVPGTGEVVAGFTDQLAFQSSGARYMDWRTGITEYGIAVTNFKIFSLTGAEGVCEPAPIEIGNRVWKDTNNNGIQDANESSLAGVTVTICAKGTTTPIATATTDVNGNYIFSTASGTTSASQIYDLTLNYNTEYDVKVTSLGSDPSVTGLALTDIALTLSETSGITNTGATLVNSDAFLVSGVPSTTLKIGSPGQNNHSYDFGFKTAIGCTIPNAGADTTLCDLTTLTLISAVSGQTWNAVSGNPSNATIDNQGVISGMTNVGVYMFYISAGSNCNDTIKVIRQNSFSKGICAGDTYELKTQSSLTNIKWYRNNILLNGSTLDTIVVRLAGTYKYEGTDANGCIIKLCCPAVFVDSTCCITPNAGIDQILTCNGTTAPTMANLGAAPSAHTWYIVTQPSGAAAAINNSGAASNLTISGDYIFELRSDADSNCKDNVKVTVPNCSVPCPSPNCRYTSVRKL